MYILIREEDGNLFAHDLLVMSFATKGEAVAEMGRQYNLMAQQPWARGGDRDMCANDAMPYAHVSDERGCGWEWRVVRPMDMTEKRRHITQDEVLRGLYMKVVRLGDSDGGVMCAIGDSWFYFADDEGTTAAEYLQRVPLVTIAGEIAEALGGLEGAEDDEWWYYRCILDENL